MTNGAILRAVDAIQRRADDVHSLFRSGAQPNYPDALRAESLEPANDPLAVVPPEGAYLVAGDPAHPAYTRDGALRLVDGALATREGTPILGFAEDDGHRHGVPRALQVDRRDLLLGRINDARVDSDGVFGYARNAIDPQTLETHVERVVVGRLALARFPAGSKPERIDRSRVSAPDGVAPLIGVPADGTFAALATRSRAIGRIDPDAAIARLQDAYLAIDALGAAERTRTGMMRDAFDLVK